jgi:hypothetical protein
LLKQRAQAAIESTGNAVAIAVLQQRNPGFVQHQRGAPVGLRRVVDHHQAVARAAHSHRARQLLLVRMKQNDQCADGRHRNSP